MIVLALLIVFTVSAVLAAIIPFLHSRNSENISRADLFEEEFNYARANTIKRVLDALFSVSLFMCALSLVVLFFLIGVHSG